MLLNKDNLIQQLSLSHFELVHLKTGKLGPCWSKLEFGRKVLSLSRPHKYWPLGQRSLKGHLSQETIFLFYSSDIIASSWCILSAISHVGVGDKISVRFRFAVLHIISVSTHSNLNHHFKNYQLFSYVDLAHGQLGTAVWLSALIWGIFESPSTGSQLQWGNWAAHEIQLQLAVCPRRENDLFNLFFGF